MTRERYGRRDSGDSEHRGTDGEPSTLPRLERIARRAFAIYEARGGAHGQSLDDWLQAEREIDAETPDSDADGSE